jgi:hypothetical protein
MSPTLVLWRDPSSEPLAGVMMHRVDVPAVGLRMVAAHLEAVFCGNAGAVLAGQHRGLTLGDQVLAPDWPIILINFEPEGLFAEFLGGTAGVPLMALEAAAFLYEMCSFEQQQAFLGMAQRAVQQQRLMQQIMAKGPAS